MALTNHATGRVNKLLRAPAKEGAGAARNLSLLVPAAVLLAGGDAATGFISPDLPGVVALGFAGTVVAGGLARSYLLPRLNQVRGGGGASPSWFCNGVQFPGSVDAEGFLPVVGISAIMIRAAPII
jgi:hypothetical protein